MSLVVFTAGAGENVSIPVKASESDEAGWTESGLAGLDSSQSGFKQSRKLSQEGNKGLDSQIFSCESTGFLE